MIGSYGNHSVTSTVTGNNTEQMDIFASNNNTTDSVVNNLGTFSTGVLSNVLTEVEPIYNTGNWVLDPTTPNLVKLIYVGTQTLDVEINVSGDLISTATVNSNHVATRLVSTSGILTGSLKTVTAGKLTGSTNVSVGFGSVCYSRFNTNDTLTFEIAKDFLGDCIVQNIIIGLRRLI